MRLSETMRGHERMDNAPISGEGVALRKADLKKNHQAFEGTMDLYINFLDRILQAKHVVGSEKDKREIAESCLLRFCAHWESFADEELVDCANIDSSRLSNFTGVKLPKNLSKAVCQAILFGGTYRDFKSVGALKDFAKKVLADTVNPFAKIIDNPVD
jgi:hypothetical protein